LEHDLHKISNGNFITSITEAAGKQEVDKYGSINSNILEVPRLQSQQDLDARSIGLSQKIPPE
jgi:hypothetical protein